MSIKTNLWHLVRSFRRNLRRTHARPHKIEQTEWAFYSLNIQPGMVIFDVGANVGLLTLLFSHFTGKNGQVHAFEPNTDTFERLSTICQVAGCTNVTLNHAAVADVQGTLNLHVYDESHHKWASLAQRPLDQYGINVKSIGIEQVPALTLDAYCKEREIATIDLLKIDVEGAEYQVLMGAHEMLTAKRIRCILFEFGQTTFDMGNSPNHFVQLFAQVGYSLRNLIEYDPIFPGAESAATARFAMHIARPAI